MLHVFARVSYVLVHSCGMKHLHLPLHRAFWKSSSKSSATTSEAEGGEGRTRSAEWWHV